MSRLACFLVLVAGGTQVVHGGQQPQSTPPSLGTPAHDAYCREQIASARGGLREARLSSADSAVEASFRRVRSIESECSDLSVDARVRASATLLALELPENRSAKAKARLVSAAEEFLALEAPRSPERIEVLEESSNASFLDGDLTTARQKASEALELREDLYGAESAEAVDGLIFTAMVRSAEAQVRDSTESNSAAREILEQALEFSTRALGPRAPATTRVWSALSGVLRELGEADEADRVFRQHVEGRDEDLEAQLPEPPERPTGPAETAPSGDRSRLEESTRGAIAGCTATRPRRCR